MKKNNLNLPRRDAVRGLTLTTLGITTGNLFGAEKIITQSDLLNKSFNMDNSTAKPLEVINKFLANTTNPDVMRTLIAMNGETAEMFIKITSWNVTSCRRQL